MGATEPRRCPPRLTTAELDAYNVLARTLSSLERVALALGCSANCIDACIAGRPWAVERVRLGLQRASVTRGGST